MPAVLWLLFRPNGTARHIAFPLMSAMITTLALGMSISFSTPYAMPSSQQQLAQIPIQPVAQMSGAAIAQKATDIAEELQINNDVPVNTLPVYNKYPTPSLFGDALIPDLKQRERKLTLDNAVDYWTQVECPNAATDCVTCPISCHYDSASGHFFECPPKNHCIQCPPKDCYHDYASGNLQCVMLVSAAYYLATGGKQLPAIGNAIDFWTDYQKSDITSQGWIPIPAAGSVNMQYSNESGLGPKPGDLMVWDDGFNPDRSKKPGHIAILTNYTAPRLVNNGNWGSVTFAQANSPNTIETQWVTADGTLQTWKGYTFKGYLHQNPVGNLIAPQQTIHLTQVLYQWYKLRAQQDATKYSIPSDKFVAQINDESGFDPNKVSPAGALGIAQFMPGTALNNGVNPWDPSNALEGAARLMSNYYRNYGDYAKALAAYNAGSGATDAAIKNCNTLWLSCMPAETQHYVHTIMGT